MGQFSAMTLFLDGVYLSYQGRHTPVENSESAPSPWTLRFSPYNFSPAEIQVTIRLKIFQGWTSFGTQAWVFIDKVIIITNQWFFWQFEDVVGRVWILMVYWQTFWLSAKFSSWTCTTTYRVHELLKRSGNAGLNEYVNIFIRIWTGGGGGVCVTFNMTYQGRATFWGVKF